MISHFLEISPQTTRFSDAFRRVLCGLLLRTVVSFARRLGNCEVILCGSDESMERFLQTDLVT